MRQTNPSFIIRPCGQNRNFFLIIYDGSLLSSSFKSGSLLAVCFFRFFRQWCRRIKLTCESECCSSTCWAALPRVHTCHCSVQPRWLNIPAGYIRMTRHFASKVMSRKPTGSWRRRHTRGRPGSHPNTQPAPSKEKSRRNDRTCFIPGLGTSGPVESLRDNKALNSR